MSRDNSKQVHNFKERIQVELEQCNNLIYVTNLNQELNFIVHETKTIIILEFSMTDS